MVPVTYVIHDPDKARMLQSVSHGVERMLQ